METKEGVLKVKIKNNGSRDNKKTHILIGKQKLSISKEFPLDNSMNGKDCIAYLEDNKLVDIKIDGQKIQKEAKKAKVKKIPRCENKSNLRVPNDTCLILQNPKVNIDNFHLKLNKFTIFNDDDEPKIKEQKISETFFNRNRNFYETKIKKHHEYIQKFNPKSFTLKTSYRLLIGSEQSIYETSIRLHHIYGIPFIPSSAIKGSFRNCIIQKYFNSNEDKALKRDWFVDIFGSQNQEGKVIFFDAFSEDIKIQTDIMTPHYKEYYGDKKDKIAPTDTQDPNPIPFLVVTGEFKFFVAVKKNTKLKIKYKEFLLLDFVERGLEKSLQNYGIGAKTAVGYGYLEEAQK